MCGCRPRRAAIGAMLTAEQLLEAAATLACTGHVYRYRMRLGRAAFQRLIALLWASRGLGPGREIHQRLHQMGVDYDLGHGQSGIGRKVRQKIASLIDERVQTKIKHLLRDPEHYGRYFVIPNATVSGDHYVLPAAGVHDRHKLPGLIHRTSGTGETIFVEPAEVAGLSSELGSAQS